jgi:MFS family permease
MNKKLRWYEHIGINAYWLGQSFAAGVISPVLLPALILFFAPADQKNTYMSVVSTIGLAVAMLIQPIFGMLSDRSTSRWGRRRPFIFIGALANSIFLFFMAISPKFGSMVSGAKPIILGFTLGFVVLLLTTILSQFSANIGQGPLQGLIPDLVPEEQRGVTSGVKAIFELLPSLLILLLGVGAMVDKGQFLLVGLLMAVVLVGTMIATIVTAKEKPLTEKPKTNITESLLRMVELTFVFVIITYLANWLIGAIKIAIQRQAFYFNIRDLFIYLSAIYIALSHSIWKKVKNQKVVVWSNIGLIALCAVVALISVPDMHFVMNAIQSTTTTSKVLIVGLAGLLGMAGTIIIGVYFSARIGVGEAASKHSSFVWWVVNRLLFLAAVVSIQGFAFYFLQDVLKAEHPATLTTILMAVVALFLMVSAWFSGKLGDKVGIKKMVLSSGLIAAVGTLILVGSGYLAYSHILVLPQWVYFALVIFSGCIIGLGAGTFMATNWALGTQLVPPEEAGKYLGISNLAGAGAGIVGKGIGGPLADYFNSVKPGLGYLVIFFLYALLFIFSALILVKIKPAPKKQV